MFKKMKVTMIVTLVSVLPLMSYAFSVPVLVANQTMDLHNYLKIKLDNLVVSKNVSANYPNQRLLDPNQSHTYVANFTLNMQSHQEYVTAIYHVDHCTRIHLIGNVYTPVVCVPRGDVKFRYDITKGFSVTEQPDIKGFSFNAYSGSASIAANSDVPVFWVSGA